MKNRLQYETSPYLLQHSENPVDWYPWGDEAFERAKTEDKPVFLSIGYSTCHWCHVMARESFEDPETAALLNEYFIPVKVDKEERPDIDSIYMAVCQAFTGSGGWPTTIFMTAGQQPFFAGTYFPPESRGNMPGMRELLNFIHDKWIKNRSELLSSASEVTRELKERAAQSALTEADLSLVGDAVEIYKKLYDGKNGGFGRAPKFPSAHNIIFLMDYYERSKDAECLGMAERTLMQMYRGGLFDHIGGGFCRYSTDARFLVPHFEKMLYDNALLISAYSKAYMLTKKDIYLTVAEKTADFVLRELKAPEGGFFCAQDADSGGEEGKYYLFTREELIRLLGKDAGEEFCAYFGIDDSGNFEGKSIPNLLGGAFKEKSFEAELKRVYEYRRQRCELRTDKKILTVWNSLMIAAMCELYKAGGKSAYLNAAKDADGFIRENLYKDGTLFVSFSGGKRGAKGFADDYAAYIFAQTALYGVLFNEEYLNRADSLCRTAISKFYDEDKGGFYLYGEDNEKLIFRPKETYDGALPSGNSLMAWNSVRLSQLLSSDYYENIAKRQLDFLSSEAKRYPAGYAVFLSALTDYKLPREKVTAVLAGKDDESALDKISKSAVIRLLREPTEEYPLKDRKTTFYICRGHNCLPAANHYE